MSIINQRLVDLFMVQMRLGFFDPNNTQPYMQFNLSNINSPAHQQLAYQAALEGVVLLKNTGSLPLNSQKITSVAVVGPNANDPSVLQGNYYGSAPYLITPYDGISKYVKSNYVMGCEVNSTDDSGFNAACAAIKSANLGILVMGLNQSVESEGHDRFNIAFPGVQAEFISAMTQCSNNPLILVIMSGGMVDLTPVLSNNKIGAILWVGYPGQSGGIALADVLFGKISPAGRLDNTWYTANYVTEVSMFNMGMRPSNNASYPNPGRTYRFFTGQPVYPFGHGISYTTFNYTVKNNSLSYVSSFDIKNQLTTYSSRYIAEPLGSITVTVTNNGSVTSDDVVLAFLVPPNPGQNGNPLKYLFGFARIHNLAPNNQATVNFPVSAWDLSLVDIEGIRNAVPGTFKVIIDTVFPSDPWEITVV